MIYSNSFNACIDNIVTNIGNPVINNSNIKTIINNIETPIALSIIRDNKDSKPITVIEPKKDYNIPEKYFKYETWMLCLPKINGTDIDFSGGYCFKFKINDLQGLITAETLCNTNKLMKKNKSPQSPSRSSSSRSSNSTKRKSISSSSLQNPLSPN